MKKLIGIILIVQLFNVMVGQRSVRYINPTIEKAQKARFGTKTSSTRGMQEVLNKKTQSNITTRQLRQYVEGPRGLQVILPGKTPRRGVGIVQRPLLMPTQATVQPSMQPLRVSVIPARNVPLQVAEQRIQPKNSFEALVAVVNQTYQETQEQFKERYIPGLAKKLKDPKSIEQFIQDPQPIIAALMQLKKPLQQELKQLLQRKTDWLSYSLESFPQEFNDAIGNPAIITQLLWNKEGSRIATGLSNGLTILWFSTGEKMKTLAGNNGAITALAFSNNDDDVKKDLLLATGNELGNIQVWNAVIDIGTLQKALTVEFGNISNLIFDSSGQRLVAGLKNIQGSSEKTLKAWYVKRWQELHRPTTTLPIVFLGSVPKSSTFVAIDSKGKVVIWNAAALTAGFTINTNLTIHAASLSPSGRWLALANTSQSIVIIDVEKKSVIKNLTTDQKNALIAFNHDGTLLASASGYNFALWSTDSWKQQYSIVMPNNDRITALSFNAQYPLVATGHQSGAIRLWNTKTGSLVQTLKAHTQKINILAFNHQGTRMASTSNDKALLWNVPQDIGVTNIGQLLFLLAIEQYQKEQKPLIMTDALKPYYQALPESIKQEIKNNVVLEEKEQEHSSLSNTEIENIKDVIHETLSADIVSPNMFREALVEPLARVELEGSMQQQQTILQFLKQHQKKLTTVIHSVVETMMHNPEILKTASTVALGAFASAAPSVALTALAVSSGNMTTEVATSAMIQAGISSVVWNMVNLAVKQKPALTSVDSPVTSAITAGVLSASLVYQELLYVPHRTITTFLQAGIIESAVEIISQQSKEVDIKRLLLGDIIPRKTQAMTVRSADPVVNFLENKFEHLLENKVVAEILTTISLAAGEGAAIALMLEMMGLGYGGSLAGVGTYAALRGGIEGVLKLATFKKLDVGLLGETSFGFAAQTMVNYVTQSVGLTGYNLTTSLLHNAAKSAVNTIFNQAGGVKGVAEKAWNIALPATATFFNKWPAIFKQDLSKTLPEHY